MTKTFHIVPGGAVVPDLSEVPAEVCFARKTHVQSRLSELKKFSPMTGPEQQERAQLKAENAALDARLREIKEEEKAHNMSSNFAGLDSPLAEVLRERMAPEWIAEIEAAALAKHRERRGTVRIAAMYHRGMNPPPAAVQYVLTEAKNIPTPAPRCICGIGLTSYARHEPVVCHVGVGGPLEPLCRKCAATHAPTLAALRAPLMQRLLTFAGLRAWLTKWLRRNRP